MHVADLQARQFKVGQTTEDGHLQDSTGDSATGFYVRQIGTNNDMVHNQLGHYDNSFIQ